MGSNPGRGIRHIFNLLRPRNLWQQAVVDDGDADPVRGEKSSDVVIDIGASDCQVLIAAVPTASMHKNKDRPTGAIREKEIETLPRRASLAIGLVADNLTFRKFCLLVQKVNSDLLDCRTSRRPTQRPAPMMAIPAPDFRTAQCENFAMVLQNARNVNVCVSMRVTWDQVN
jgi:hypothetical protein